MTRMSMLGFFEVGLLFTVVVPQPLHRAEGTEVGRPGRSWDDRALAGWARVGQRPAALAAGHVGLHRRGDVHRWVRGLVRHFQEPWRADGRPVKQREGLPADPVVLRRSSRCHHCNTSWPPQNTTTNNSGL